MKTKKYKSKEKSLSQVEEPVTTYGATIANSNDVVISNLSSESLDDKPEGFDACYAKLKAEADEKFGNKELMTVDEYFGKLWYIVEGLYETASTSSEERKAQFLELAGSWSETAEGEEYYQMMKHRNEERPANRIISFPQE